MRILSNIKLISNAIEIIGTKMKEQRISMCQFVDQRHSTNLTQRSRLPILFNVSLFQKSLSTSLLLYIKIIVITYSFHMEVVTVQP